MSAPLLESKCVRGLSNMLHILSLCLILGGLWTKSMGLEFMQPSDVLSISSSACIVATSFNSESLIRVIQHLDDVSFRDEPLVQFGAINSKLFAWPNEIKLVVKEDPSSSIRDTDLIVFPRIKRDRTCLLMPDDKVSVPYVHVYRGSISIETVVDFINHFCETYRNSDGSISLEGSQRKEITDNLFHVERVSRITMGDLYDNNRDHVTEFCESNESNLRKCIKQHNSDHKAKYVKNNEIKMRQCDKIPVPTQKNFLNNYLKRSKPVIIQGATSNWPAFQKWTSEFLRERYGEKVVHIKLTPKGEFEGVEPVSLWESFNTFQIPEAVKTQLQFPDLVVVRPATLNIPFSEFLDMVESVANGSVKNMSAYLEYTSIKDIMHELEEDVDEMPFFKNMLRLKHLNIWLSDGNTLGKTHFDPYDNFLCMIQGKKEVVLFDPHDNSQLYEAHIPEAILSFNKTLGMFRRKTLLDSTSMVMSPVDILNPDFQHFPKFAKAYPLNCTIEEGEVLFLPAFWWHEVQSYPNVKEGRNLAVNFWYDPFLTKEFPCPECKLDVNPAYRHLL